jgi:hypothetical protein
MITPDLGVSTIKPPSMCQRMVEANPGNRSRERRELRLTKAAVREMTKSTTVLSNDWVVRIVSVVGSRGESFERYLGVESRPKLQRGPNALWTASGLQYSPPFRCGIS